MAERLVYYPDSNPGIRREKRGRGFSYINVDGTRIDCPKKRRALQALAVPPAYTDVWMAPMGNAHLLATGRDARTRKQYRYHPDWAAQRAQTKFEGLGAFGQSLPTLRRWIDQHLSGEVGSEDTAVAAVLALVDRAALRPWSRAYVTENRTYGATTLKRRHLRIEGDAIALAFKGKGGKPVEKTLRGRKLAKVMEACQDLPGPSLVSWLDEDGNARSVSSDQLNAKLNELCQTDATAKTLRTARNAGRFRRGSRHERDQHQVAGRGRGGASAQYASHCAEKLCTPGCYGACAAEDGHAQRAHSEN